MKGGVVADIASMYEHFIYFDYYISEKFDLLVDVICVLQFIDFVNYVSICPECFSKIYECFPFVKLIYEDGYDYREVI